MENKKETLDEISEVLSEKKEEVQSTDSFPKKTLTPHEQLEQILKYDEKKLEECKEEEKSIKAAIAETKRKIKKMNSLMDKIGQLL